MPRTDAGCALAWAAAFPAGFRRSGQHGEWRYGASPPVSVRIGAPVCSFGTVAGSFPHERGDDRRHFDPRAGRAVETLPRPHRASATPPWGITVFRFSRRQARSNPPTCGRVGTLARNLTANLTLNPSSTCVPPRTCRPACHRKGQARFFRYSWPYFPVFHLTMRTARALKCRARRSTDRLNPTRI